jgi:thiamine-phosphate pyrophosphorylase
MLQGLYVLTSDTHYPHHTWIERIECIIQGGAEFIQLREKTLSDQALQPLAQDIQHLCHDYGATLIINDRVSLARRIRADGVHIGQTDCSLRHARELLGNKKIIGVSCYRSIYQALLAQKQGADYVAFGRLFSSHTKPSAQQCPINVLQNACKQLKPSICAIGGITLNNVNLALRAGAHLIASTHTVFNAQDPYQAANNFHQVGIMHR